ncbi:DUF3822 family protein [Lentimicrobium sp.]|uniref:DUF3822 family protein n=1 Tax=Lentimicrobium sp. TaxID=2034841 RepID=UPI00345EB27E
MPGDYQTQFSVYDRLFDPAVSEEFFLSIRIEPDGLSFSVYSPAHGRYIGLESLTFPDSVRIKDGPMAGILYSDYLSRLLTNHPVLTNNYRKVCAIFHSRFFTLVPGPLFNDDLAGDYLQFVHKIGADSRILIQNLRSADIRLVYGVYQGLIQEMESRFPDARKVHETGALLDSLLPRFKRSEAPELIFVNIEYGSAGITVLRGGLPVFCNAFECRTHEDTVYFIMFVMEQLALNPEKTPLYLLGKTGKEDALFRLLAKYVKKVDLLEQSGPQVGGYVTVQSETHRYYTLLNPSLCEL